MDELSSDWWRDERTRLLPGEEGDPTVYVVDFYDQCKYFGYTLEPVFYRAAPLAAATRVDDTSQFVQEHAVQVPYVIRCVKSGLNGMQARRLRDLLVAKAPQNVSAARQAIVETENCWLKEVQAQPSKGQEEGEEWPPFRRNR